jgi:hypothetical protein
VSFKVEAAELFWTQLRSLPVLVQEQVLDLVEELLDDPRGQTDRGIALPINAVATRLTLIEVGESRMRISIAFQFKDDEETLLVHGLVIVPDD